MNKNGKNYREVAMQNTVVKTNRLNMAIQNLSIFEIKLIALAIVDARESNTGLSAEKPLHISAMRFSSVMNSDSSDAYKNLRDAAKNLFERKFTFLSDRNNEVNSRWVSQIEYLKGEGVISIILTPAVVNEITRIDGAEQFFSQYGIEQIANLNSIYSVRLYELLNQWRSAAKTPIFELEVFRLQMGIDVLEYTRMGDFKKRVLDSSVKEINEKTDLKVSYEQEKKGRQIVGFKFKVLPKDKPKGTKQQGIDRDADTADMFTIEGLNDNQLGRIARNPSFVADYNHLVSSTSPAGQDPKAWEFEMINRLKKDASQFKKRPVRDYLHY